MWKKFFAGAILFEVTLLVVGLTWVGPDQQPTAEAQASVDAEDYRILGQGTGNVVEVELDAVETVQELEPGVEFHVWTFGGTAPGPVIRVTEGDTVRFTVNNESTQTLSHSMDFHAAQTPWDVNYQPVPPGESFSFDWVARFPGVFMYHCGVPPVLQHIANGMYGAIIVEPAEPLPAAREYVLVSSEFYPGSKPVHGVLEGDLERMSAADPQYVVFNGAANRYVDQPLQARPGEPIRLWVMNAGPTLTNAFHVIGALFDHVYADGNPASVLNGIQTWNVPPGGGAMFELTIPDEGMYPFVTHSFAYTGLGAVGVLQVTPDAPERPAAYPAMASPFDGGLTEAEGTVEGGGPPVTTAGGGDSGEGDHVMAGEAVAVSAAITGFDPSSVEVREGEVAIELTNAEAIPHDFTIDELGVQEALGPEETVTFTFDAKVGTYDFYCSIPGHRESGMEGTITVLPGAAH